MSRCSVRRGMFVLRDCGKPPVYTCVDCSRGMCEQHGSEFQGDVLCTDCRAKKEEGVKNGASAKKSRMRDDNYTMWPYYYRHNYYSNYHYSPFYSGHHRDRYYNDYDVRSFDQTKGDPTSVDDGDEGPDLMDS